MSEQELTSEMLLKGIQAVTRGMNAAYERFQQLEQQLQQAQDEARHWKTRYEELLSERRKAEGEA